MSEGQKMTPEENFMRKIEAGEKIEPKDWMPDAYRKNLIRQIANRGYPAFRATTTIFMTS